MVLTKKGPNPHDTGEVSKLEANTRFPFRKLVRRLLMTACDLCTSAKPWSIHLSSVKKVFEEFYLQVSILNLTRRYPIVL